MSIRHPTAAVEIRLYCARCGRPYYSGECKHQGTMTATMSDAEALRVQARYALGKRSNPDHDTTSYRDAATADVEQARDAAHDQQDHDRSAAT